MIVAEKNTNAPVVGILEWFRPGEYQRVEHALKDMKTLGINHLRTGISWADWHVEGTKEWYDWLFPTLAANLDLLPCFLYTPPSLSEKNRTSAPPVDLKSYADFIDIMITRYGEHFEWVELWNEPNNRLEYDFTLDYSWGKFAKMISMAAYWAKHRGKKVLLGGMSPIDPNWLQVMFEHEALNDFHAIGVHGFPHVFDQQWTNWEENLEAVRQVVKNNNADLEVWISETGFSTWQHDEVKQLDVFKKAIRTSAERVYWYSLNDLDPKNATVGGFHLDEREYYFGLKKTDGSPKLLYRLLEKGGLKNIHQHDYIEKHYHIQPQEKYTLITGGAGFIGTNLANRLLQQGERVMVYDNLSRPGVENNLAWLKKKYPENLLIQIADVKEARVLKECVNHARQVFHLSAQVAVTTSLINPLHDFEVNMQGTMNLLESVRTSKHRPPIIFTSTNKVYGNLGDMPLALNVSRYLPESSLIGQQGVAEDQPLNFHSPYGCSKGAADQYILDYARSFGLQTAVFRMSCIYGPHQFGTEDQGWVAHFLIRALEQKPITVYGNGKQVRDILFVDDLVNAFLLARDNMPQLAGEVFNIGGGPENTVSLLEILQLIEENLGAQSNISYQRWRTGDQPYYVSNTQKFKAATGWQPQVGVQDGLEQLTNWLKINSSRKAIKNASSKKLQV